MENGDVYAVVNAYSNPEGLSPEEIEEKFKTYLTALQIALIRKSPFYSGLLSKMCSCVLATPEQCVKYQLFTAGTDGRHILFCPAYVARINSAQFNFVVMHELYHILMNHVARMRQAGVEDGMQWNVACDGAINPLVGELAEMFGDWGLQLEVSGECVLFRDEQGEVRKESAETFYTELKQKEKDEQGDKQEGSQGDEQGGESNTFGDGQGAEQSGQGEESNTFGGGQDDEQGDEQSGQGEQGDSQGGSEEEQDGSQGGSKEDEQGTGNGMERVLQRITGISSDLIPEAYAEFYDGVADPMEQDLSNFVEATFKEACRKDRGSAPGSLLAKYESMIRKVPVKWSTYLRRFMTAKQNEDVSFSTPNRLYLPHGIIRPGDCDGEALNNISFYLDTSGSVNDEELAEFFSVAYSIADQFKASISVFLWSTSVYAEYWDISYDDCKKMLAEIKAVRGGTQLHCCIEHMASVNRGSTCNVVVTDGYVENINYDVPRFVKKKTLIALEATNEARVIENVKKAGKVVSM